MNADERGSLSPSQSKRLWRAFIFMAFNSVIFSVLLIVSLYDSRQKDERIQSLLQQQLSLMQDVGDLVERVKLAVDKSHLQTTNVGVPLDIDEAAPMDSNPTGPIDLPSPQRVR